MVSLIGLGIGTFVLWFFTDVVGLFYLVSGTIGACLSVINDFVFHQIWTFSRVIDKEINFVTKIRRFLKFAASKAIGFLIGLVVLAFFTQIIGFQYLISNLLAVGASFIFNYAMSSLWVWAKDNKSEKK